MIYDPNDYLILCVSAAAAGSIWVRLRPFLPRITAAWTVGRSSKAMDGNRSASAANQEILKL